MYSDNAGKCPLMCIFQLSCVHRWFFCSCHYKVHIVFLTSVMQFVTRVISAPICRLGFRSRTYRYEIRNSVVFIFTKCGLRATDLVYAVILIAGESDICRANRSVTRRRVMGTFV